MSVPSKSKFLNFETLTVLMFRVVVAEVVVVVRSSLVGCSVRGSGGCSGSGGARRHGVVVIVFVRLEERGQEVLPGLYWENATAN